MEWNTSSIISHTKTYWPDKSCKLCQSQKICEILEYTDFTWPTYSRITAQKNEEILNGKLHFLFSVYKLNNDYLSEFIWFVFSRTWTEYGERLCISPHSIRMRENAEQKNPRIRTFFTQYPFLYMIR